jgi:hypothetical protein
MRRAFTPRFRLQRFALAYKVRSEGNIGLEEVAAWEAASD